MAPAEVLKELVTGVTEHPTLAMALGLTWLEIVVLTDVHEIVAFARYKAEFAGGERRNNGEATVLAWVLVHGGVAIIDERAAIRAAHRDGIDVHGTLWLTTNGLKSLELTRVTAEQMVDDLAGTEMKLPVDGAGFFAWAYREGLLP